MKKKIWNSPKFVELGVDKTECFTWWGGIDISWNHKGDKDHHDWESGSGKGCWYKN